MCGWGWTVVHLMSSIVIQCTVYVLIAFVRVAGGSLTPLIVVSNDRVVSVIGAPQCLLQWEPNVHR